MLSTGPIIKEVRLFPVCTPRLYGEPSQHIIVRLTASDGTIGWVGAPALPSHGRLSPLRSMFAVSGEYFQNQRLASAHVAKSAQVLGA